MAHILEIIAHRGPDDASLVELNTLNGTLGHRRLSIIDLDARSNQPFFSEDGRFVIVFNGEIYNYPELKEILLQRGVHFRTSSDTEVLLYWLVEYGANGLDQLDGMFAFAFGDLEEQRLLLARDQIGEKPLYYSLDVEKQNFSFCSEIKGLLVLPHINRNLNREALADYLRFLYTAPPHTFYNGISELAPGHYIQADLSAFRFSVQSFYDIEDHVTLHKENGTAFYEQFRCLFDKSVKHRLHSDVPVCIYLSGGLDSNAIMASARHQKTDEAFHTYTIRYSGSIRAQDNDESVVVQQVTRQVGASNTLIDFSLDQPFLQTVEHVVDMFDQPFGNSTAIVSELLAREVTRQYRVALVGDGGDEVQAAYPRYRALLWHRKGSIIPRPLWKLAAWITGKVPVKGRYVPFIRRLQQFTAGMCKPPAEAFLDWSSYLDSETLGRVVGSNHQSAFYRSLLELFERHQHDLMRAATLVDIKSFIPFNLMQCADRASMANSLEVRSPYLATRLIHFNVSLDTVNRLHEGGFKPLVKKAYRELIPEIVLNTNRRATKKKVFNPPIYDYMKKNLDLLTEYLLGTAAQSPKLLNPSFLSEQLDAFRSGAKDNSAFLWGLAILECWLRRNPTTYDREDWLFAKIEAKTM